jgi:hypothetical protein
LIRCSDKIKKRRTIVLHVASGIVPCTRETSSNRSDISAPSSTWWGIIGRGRNDTIILVEIKSVRSTAVVSSITIADHVATIIGLERAAGSGSAITFAGVFHTGVGVSSVVAGVHAFLGSGVSVHVLAEGERTCSCIITTIE